MENCIIKKMRGTIVNENLKEIGKGIATIVVSSSPDIRVGVICSNINGGGTIELIEGDSAKLSLRRNDANMSKDGNVITVTNHSQSAYVSGSSNNWLVFNGVGTYKLLYDKYNMFLYIMGNDQSKTPKIGLDLNDLKYLQSPAYIQASGFWTALNFNGDISVFAQKLKSSTDSFLISQETNPSNPLYGYMPEGNIESLVQCENLVKIGFDKCSKLQGNLGTLLNSHPNKGNIQQISLINSPAIQGGSLSSMLGSLTSLATFDGENNAHFSGSVEDLAQAQVTAGRTSGQLKINGYMPNVVPSSASSGRTIKFGASMVEPTEEETAQGYQIV